MGQNYSTQFECVSDEAGPAEWEARVDLAACYRFICSHITVRIPGREEHLLNLYGRSTGKLALPARHTSRVWSTRVARHAVSARRGRRKFRLSTLLALKAIGQV